MKIFQSEKEFDDAVGDAKGFLLLAFVASWCRPCRLMMPTVEKIETECKEVRVCGIDVDAMDSFCENFSLVGTPTYILFQNGTERGRIVGYHDEESFRQKLKNLMEEETM